MYNVTKYFTRSLTWNEMLYGVYCSLDIFRVIISRTVACLGDRRGTCGVLVGRPEGKERSWKT